MRYYEEVLRRGGTGGGIRFLVKSGSTLGLFGGIILSRAEKKILALAKKLERISGMDEHERILMARSLLATPDERWEMHQTFLRSHGLFSHSERKKFGFKSPE